ncbi:MAG: pre-peptidase C-terminal domain-containing protein [Bacteroidota bacterium]
MKHLFIFLFSLISCCCLGNDAELLTNFCHPSKTLHCGEIYHGSTTHEDDDVDHYGHCGTGFHGRDKIFKIVKHSHQGRLTVNLWNNKGLDLFLLDRCDGSHVNCIDSKIITSETPYAGISRELNAGTYYFSVDAKSHSVHGDFTISATCGYLDCHDAEKLFCKETKQGNTHHGENNISAVFPYGGGGGIGGLTGKERLYYFELSRREQVTIDLTNVDHHADLDLFLLKQCDDASMLAQSVNRRAGGNESITTTLDAGKYYVLVDGYKGSNGNFKLTVDWNCCQEHTQNNCHDITATSLGNFKYRFEVPNTSLYSGAKWIVKGGQYGTSGREIGSGFSTEWTFPSAGTYTICVKYPQQHSHNCYSYCCKEIIVPPHCPPDTDHFCNYISAHQTNALTYNLTNTNTSITALSWTVNDNPIAGSGNSISYTFPAAGEYTICFKYRKHDGCYAYCCKKIMIPPHCPPDTDHFCNYISAHQTNALTYNLTNTNTSITALSWTVNDNPIAGSGNSISYTFPAAGEYTICFKYRKHDGCYAYCCKKIMIPPPCEDETNPFCNYISAHLVGSNGLTYNLTNTNTSITALSWTVNDNPIAGSGNSISYTFPAAGEYTICFKYRKHDGCYAYCCKKIFICKDEWKEYCDEIDYYFSGTTTALTYTFSSSSSVTNGTWTITGGSLSGTQNVGSGTSLTYTFPAPGTYKVCYKYQKHDGCYVYCCKTICVAYPFDCRLIKKRFDYHTGKYTLSLEGIGAENIITWKNETTGQDVGNGATLVLDNPFQCVVISVFYRDPHTGCYKVCCIQLCRVCYGEQDPNCNAINWYYNGSNYSFSVPSTSEYNGGMWTVTGPSYGRDVINAGTERNMTWSFPSSGKYTVCYTYTAFDGFKFSCCKTIWVEAVSDCGLITVEYESHSNSYRLSIEEGEQVTWRDEQRNQNIGTGSTISVSNPNQCTFISAVFFDRHTGCYRTCRIELCPYAPCFGDDPYFIQWIGQLRSDLAEQCSSNPNVRIETAYYLGQCVIIVPPFDNGCGINKNTGHVFDAAGNLIFSYGGVDPNYNEDLVARLRNQTTLWSCGNTNSTGENGEIVLEERSEQSKLNTADLQLSNQPNPFSAETLIRFTLPKEDIATVRIVDALGQTVFEMVETFTAGENEVFFDEGQNLAAGIYFLQIESADRTASHTMIVENQ